MNAKEDLVELVGEVLTDSLTAPEAQELADEYVKRHALPRVFVEFAPVPVILEDAGLAAGRYGFPDGRPAIQLSWSGMSVRVLFHELAHHRVFIEAGMSNGDHGPLWLRFSDEAVAEGLQIRSYLRAAGRREAVYG